MPGGVSSITDKRTDISVPVMVPEEGWIGALGRKVTSGAAKVGISAATPIDVDVSAYDSSILNAKMAFGELKGFLKNNAKKFNERDKLNITEGAINDLVENIANPILAAAQRHREAEKAGKKDHLSPVKVYDLVTKVKEELRGMSADYNQRHSESSTSSRSTPPPQLPPRPPREGQRNPFQ